MKKLSSNPVRRIGVVVLILAFVLGLIGYRPGRFIEDFSINISVELASIAITVLVIDYLNERHRSFVERHYLKSQLIREMGNLDNGIALRAVKEMDARGFLIDGSLVGADLEGANLARADLSAAKISRASLNGAKLQETKLRQADLQFAGMEWANFCGANLGHGSS